MQKIIKNAKPCPMCGCKEILLEENADYKILTVYIKCIDCGLTGFKSYFYTTENPIEKTIEYWNTRV